MQHDSSVPNRARQIFLRSLNVERDQGSLELTNQYLLTSNALAATRRILGAVEGGVGGAWTLTGPFGTGKSAYCLFLSHLIGPPKDKGTPLAIHHLRNADAMLARRSFPNATARLNYETLALSGTAEPISAAVARAIAHAPFLHKRSTTRLVAAKARRLYRALSSEDKSRTAEVLDLVDATVKSLYSSYRNHRLLLMLDEAGKFLEYAAHNSASSDVFFLQQLAEYAARSEGRLLVVFVLHQDFREYAAPLTSVERAEWEKIRGRFEDIAFEEPPSQLLRFLAMASEQNRASGALKAHDVARQAINQLEAGFWKLGLAPCGLERNAVKALLTSCAPLHPLVTVLLGPLFRRVGQNERSAFSFLASDDPTAIRSWSYSKHEHRRRLFDLVDLYHHVIQSLGNVLLHTGDAKRWSEAFEAEARHPHFSPNAVAVLRSIALLGIAARWHGVRATRDTLHYGLSERFTHQAIDVALQELESASVVVLRQYNQTFAIWEGSDVDVESRLAEGRSRVGDLAEIAPLLCRLFRTRPVLARRHSFMTGTLRLFEVRFVEADQLGHLAADCLHQDGQILIALPKRGRSCELYKDDVNRFGARTLIRAIRADDRLATLALELAAVDWAQRNTPELAQDSTARRELYERRRDAERQLRNLIDSLLSVSENKVAGWFHLGKQVRIMNGRELNEKLSRICDKVFHAAPRLDNEIINRHELSSSAAAARRNLIQLMIDRGSEPELGLTGNPPERSIYRSLLSAEGLCLHRKGSGTWSFRTPPKVHENRAGSAYALFCHIEAFLHEAEQTPKSLNSLFDSLRQPPFGLRDGPIPVFVCAALLANEADVAVYYDGQFCLSLSAPLFETLMKSPERFAVRRLRISGVTAEVFQKLGKLLGQIDLGAGGAKQRVLAIARPLLRFAASLSDYSRNTAELSPETLRIRDVLFSSKEPEEMLLTGLPSACGVRPFKAKDRGRTGDVSRYVDALHAAIVELRGSLPTLQGSIRQAIADTFGEHGDSTDGHASLQARAGALREFAVEPDLRILLDRMAASFPESDAWVDGVASFVAERILSRWRDEDRARFAVRLRQFTRRFALLEATVASRPQVTKLNGTESIRIALTSTRFGQVDHAIHIGRAHETRIRAIAEKIDSAFAESDSPVAVAALCKVLERRLSGKGMLPAASFEGDTG